MGWRGGQRFAECTWLNNGGSNHRGAGAGAGAGAAGESIVLVGGG